MDAKQVIKVGTSLSSAAGTVKKVIDVAANISASQGVLRGGRGWRMRKRMMQMDDDSADDLIIVDNAGNRKIFDLVHRVFARHQKLIAELGFQTRVDPGQTTLNRFMLGVRAINTTSAQMLKRAYDCKNRYDLAMFVAFKHIQDKHFFEGSKISDFKQFMLVLIPVMFSHYCQIKENACPEEKQYKHDGLELMIEFLTGCRELVQDMKPGVVSKVLSKATKALFRFSDDIGNVIDILRFAIDVTQETTATVKLQYQLRDEAERLKALSGMAAIWFKFMVLSTLVNKGCRVPSTFTKDLLIIDDTVWEAGHLEYAVSKSMADSTLLHVPEDTKAKPEEKKQDKFVLWHLNKVHLIHHYLTKIRNISLLIAREDTQMKKIDINEDEKIEKAKDTIRALRQKKLETIEFVVVALGYNPDIVRLYSRKSYGEDAATLESIEFPEYERTDETNLLYDALGEGDDVAKSRSDKLMKKEQGYFRFLSRVAHRSLALYHMSELLFYMTEQLCRFCDEHGDESIQIKSVGDFRACVESHLDLADKMLREYRRLYLAEDSYYGNLKSCSILGSDGEMTSQMMESLGAILVAMREIASEMKKHGSEARRIPDSIAEKQLELWLHVFQHENYSQTMLYPPGKQTYRHPVSISVCDKLCGIRDEIALKMLPKEAKEKAIQVVRQQFLSQRQIEQRFSVFGSEIQQQLPVSAKKKRSSLSDLPARDARGCFDGAGSGLGGGEGEGEDIDRDESRDESMREEDRSDDSRFSHASESEVCRVNDESPSANTNAIVVLPRRMLSRAGSKPAPACRDKQMLDRLLKDFFQSLLQYQHFVYTQVSFAGRYLTGSHSNRHVQDAENLYDSVLDVNMKNDRTPRQKIRHIRRMVAQHTRPVPQGPFGFFASRERHHDFVDFFLSKDVPNIHVEQSVSQCSLGTT